MLCFYLATFFTIQLVMKSAVLTMKSDIDHCTFSVDVDNPALFYLVDVDKRKRAGWSTSTILLFSIWLMVDAVDARRRPFYSPFHHALFEAARFCAFRPVIRVQTRGRVCKPLKTFSQVKEQFDLIF